MLPTIKQVVKKKHVKNQSSKKQKYNIKIEFKAKEKFITMQNDMMQ